MTTTLLAQRKDPTLIAVNEFKSKIILQWIQEL